MAHSGLRKSADVIFHCYIEIAEAGWLGPRVRGSIWVAGKVSWYHKTSHDRASHSMEQEACEYGSFLVSLPLIQQPGFNHGHAMLTTLSNPKPSKVPFKALV